MFFSFEYETFYILNFGQKFQLNTKTNTFLG